MWLSNHKCCLQVVNNLISPVDVAIATDAHRAVEVEAKVGGEVDEVVHCSIVDIHERTLQRTDTSALILDGNVNTHNRQWSIQEMEIACTESMGIKYCRIEIFCL